MLCEKCGTMLTAQEGIWFVSGLGERAIRLLRYVCENKECEDYQKRFFKDIKTGMMIDPPLTEKEIEKLERYRGELPEN